MSPSVKLHYFPATGRAQQIRMVLAAGGVPFEDDFQSRAKWSALTNNNTTFAVPILTVDEDTPNQRVYVQSSAILRKVGRMGDLKMTLQTDEDGEQAAYLTDRAISDADDLRTAGYKSFVTFGASKEAGVKYATQVLPKHIDNLERQFVAAGGDYWGGSSTLSVADVTVYEAVAFFGLRLIDGAKGVENPCGPALKAWIERVESNDRIKAYLESDQFKNIPMKFTKEALGYVEVL